MRRRPRKRRKPAKSIHCYMAATIKTTGVPAHLIKECSEAPNDECNKKGVMLARCAFVFEAHKGGISARELAVYLNRSESNIFRLKDQYRKIWRQI